MINMMFKFSAKASEYLRSSIILTFLALIAFPFAARAEGTAIVLDLEGALGVATAEYIIGGIEQAEEEGANVVIIRMDTPGGLVSPMRDIVQSILGSEVPVVTYVSPGGARAGQRRDVYPPGEPYCCNGANDSSWRCYARFPDRR